MLSFESGIVYESNCLLKPSNAARDLSLERRETVWSLSTIGVEN